MNISKYAYKRVKSYTVVPHWGTHGHETLYMLAEYYANVCFDSCLMKLLNMRSIYVAAIYFYQASRLVFVFQ